MSLSVHCPRCGRVLTPDAPKGLCPACLLVIAMQAEALGPLDATSEAGGLFAVPTESSKRDRDEENRRRAEERRRRGRF
jgi:hypothetical protein